MENYKLGSLVGKGAFGDVYVAIDRRSNKRVAVKKVSKNKIPDMSEMERVLQEFSILVTLNNRNVIKLMEVVSDAQGIGLVMEFAGGGTLATLLSGFPDEKMSEDEARTHFLPVLRGVIYCHRQRVVHRDIKPENILLAEEADGKMVLKLADFGLSVKGSSILHGGGTPLYTAPEVLFPNRYPSNYLSRRAKPGREKQQEWGAVSSAVPSGIEGAGGDFFGGIRDDIDGRGAPAPVTPRFGAANPCSLIPSSLPALSNPILYKEYDAALTDSWSLGCLLFRMVVGTLPYPAVSTAGLQELIFGGLGIGSASPVIDCETAQEWSGTKGSGPPPAPPYPASLSPSLHNLLSLLLEVDPLRRPKASDIGDHPWLRNLPLEDSLVDSRDDATPSSNSTPYVGVSSTLETPLTIHLPFLAGDGGGKECGFQSLSLSSTSTPFNATPLTTPASVSSVTKVPLSPNPAHPSTLQDKSAAASEGASFLSGLEGTRHLVEGAHALAATADATSASRPVEAVSVGIQDSPKIEEGVSGAIVSAAAGVGSAAAGGCSAGSLASATTASNSVSSTLEPPFFFNVPNRQLSGTSLAALGPGKEGATSVQPLTSPLPPASFRRRPYSNSISHPPYMGSNTSATVTLGGSSLPPAEAYRGGHARSQSSENLSLPAYLPPMDPPLLNSEHTTLSHKIPRAKPHDGFLPQNGAPNAGDPLLHILEDAAAAAGVCGGASNFNSNSNSNSNNNRPPILSGGSGASSYSRASSRSGSSRSNSLGVVSGPSLSTVRQHQVMGASYHQGSNVVFSEDDSAPHAQSPHVSSANGSGTPSKQSIGSAAGGALFSPEVISALYPDGTAGGSVASRGREGPIFHGSMTFPLRPSNPLRSPAGHMQRYPKSLSSSSSSSFNSSSSSMSHSLVGAGFHGDVSAQQLLSPSPGFPSGSTPRSLLTGNTRTLPSLSTPALGALQASIYVAPPTPTPPSSSSSSYSYGFYPPSSPSIQGTGVGFFPSTPFAQQSHGSGASLKFGSFVTSAMSSSVSIGHVTVGTPSIGRTVPSTSHAQGEPLPSPALVPPLEMETLQGSSGENEGQG